MALATTILYVLVGAGLGVGGYKLVRHYYDHEATAEEKKNLCPTDDQLTKMVLDIDSGALSIEKATEVAQSYAAMGPQCATTAGALNRIIAVVKQRTLIKNGTVKNVPGGGPGGSGEKAMPNPDLVKGVKSRGVQRPPWLGGMRA